MLFYNEKIFKRCFDWRGKYWYKNIKEIPRYFKLMHHLIKYGYDEYATWETFDWFIDTMGDILTRYRNNHISYPIMFNRVDPSEEQEEYDLVIDTMINLLGDMDEDNPKYNGAKTYDDFCRKRKAMLEAKDEFFRLFSEYFYNLWD